MDKTSTHTVRISNQDWTVSDEERSTSNFKVSFRSKPLDVKDNVMEVMRVSYYNTIPTIYGSSYGALQNDTLSFSGDGGDTWTNATINHGKYTIEEFVLELNRVTDALGLPSFNETAWRYDKIKMRLVLTLPATGRFRLQSKNGAYAVIGSSQIKGTQIVGGRVTIGVNGTLTMSETPKDTVQIMPWTPDMSAGISNLYVYFDPPICEGYVSGQHNNSLGSLVAVVPVSGERGAHITHIYTESPQFSIQYHGLLEHLRVRICDSTGTPVNFGALELFVVVRFYESQHAYANL